MYFFIGKTQVQNISSPNTKEQIQQKEAATPGPDGQKSELPCNGLPISLQKPTTNPTIIQERFDLSTVKQINIPDGSLSSNAMPSGIPQSGMQKSGRLDSGMTMVSSGIPHTSTVEAGIHCSGSLSSGMGKSYHGNGHESGLQEQNEFEKSEPEIIAYKVPSALGTEQNGTSASNGFVPKVNGIVVPDIQHVRDIRAIINNSIKQNVINGSCDTYTTSCDTQVRPCDTQSQSDSTQKILQTSPSQSNIVLRQPLTTTCKFKGHLSECVFRPFFIFFIYTFFIYLWSWGRKCTCNYIYFL